MLSIHWDALVEKNLDLITLKLRRINPKVIRAKTKKTVQYVQHYFLTPAFFINQTQLGTWPMGSIISDLGEEFKN